MGWYNYRLVRLDTNRKTFETKVIDEGLIEHSNSIKAWQDYKDESYPLFRNFNFETDDEGVKVATFVDSVGRHLKMERISPVVFNMSSVMKGSKKIDTKEIKYDVRDKLNYFSKRVNNKRLTDGQRRYAEQRLMTLKKSL